jgi:hypothetical protein
MQDFGKIIIGIIVFLVLLSIPVIVTQASGNADYDPESKLAESLESIEANSCINSNSAEYMRVHHSDLLYDYRTWAVRDDASGDTGDVYWTDEDGNKQLFSLNGTCLGCHTDRDAFCNVCHDYTAIQPNCWDCHDLSGVK